LVSLAEDGYEIPVDFKTVKSIYRRLIFSGFTPQEAAKFCAHYMGIDTSDTLKKEWTMKELQHMDFLRSQSTRP